MDLVKFYFEKDMNRIRLLLTAFYLACVCLMTKNILSLFGYHYSLPKDITLSVVLDFILSGQILVPALFFTIYIFITSIGGHYGYALSFVLAKKYIYKGWTDTGYSIKIRKDLLRDKFIEETELGYKKGANYDRFPSYLDLTFDNSFHLGSLIRLITSLFFQTSLLLLIFTNKSIFIWCLAILSSLISILALHTLVNYISIARYRPYYQMFINHIENPTLHSRPVGYSPQPYQPNTKNSSSGLPL